MRPIYDLWFAQGDDAEEFLTLFDEEGPDAVAERILGCMDPRECATRVIRKESDVPWGSSDTVCRVRYADGTAFVSVNESMGYIGVCFQFKERG